MTAAHNEFELISEYFSCRRHHRQDVSLGIGDDAALCLPPPNTELAIAVDTLVAGVHFPVDTNPADIGWKALAVNLSDMAAMGAAPAWMTLALTTPQADSGWLAAFSNGLFELADSFNLALIGGDTTRGPLTISIQLIGFTPIGKALRRNRAQTGDHIYVTGTLGGAGLGLQVCLAERALPESDEDYVRNRLNRPEPRVATGLVLREIASSAIDISDGLVADLGHILAASDVGAQIQVEHLPISSALHSNLPLKGAQQLALTAGDDYELCFTVPPEREAMLSALNLPHPVTRIGVIEKSPGLRCIDVDGRIVNPLKPGYLHF